MPKLAMGRRNCSRSLAYWRATARQSLAAPTEPAPSLKRPMLRMLNAILWPCPTWPSTLPAPTRASSRITWRVDEPRMPSFFSSGPVESPGVLRSTRKAVKCSPPTLAKTVKRSAKPALVMNCLVPVSR